MPIPSVVGHFAQRRRIEPTSSRPDMCGRTRSSQMMATLAYEGPPFAKKSESLRELSWERHARVKPRP